ENAPSRIRPVIHRTTRVTRRPAARDVYVPRLHALLRAESRRPLRREASDGPEATHAKAAHGAYGTAAAHAYALARTAPVVVQYPAWALSLLRFAEQLSGIGRFLPRSLSGLVSRASTPKPAAAHVGPVQSVARALSSSPCGHCPHAGGSRLPVSTTHR